MSKIETMAVATIINILSAKLAEIEQTWVCSDSGLTWAAVPAVGALKSAIADIAVYDRVSLRYVAKMDAALEAAGVHVYEIWM